jgi:hypothetical protein
VAVAVPGETPSESASAPVWTSPPSRDNRYIAFNFSRSDFERLDSMDKAAET